MKVIRVIAFANGTPCTVANQYLKTFDFEAYNGRGFATFTADARKAMKFANAGEAMTFWRTRSKKLPTRPDGKANRPFTSTTIEIVDEDDKGSIVR
jgi:hypothetical protein